MRYSRDKIAFSFFSDIKNLYLKLIAMEELVWISSMGWIFWFVDMLFPGQAGILMSIFFLLLTLWFFYTIQTRRGGRGLEKKWHKWRKSFMRLFNIPGSILFLFLFLNYFLKISKTISQTFSKQIEVVQEAYSMALLAGFVLTLFILGISHFLYIFKRFLKGEIERRLFWSEAASIIFLVVIFLPLFCNRFYLPFYGTFILFLLKWFFGTSLLFLHLNYLMGEIKTLFKIQR